MRRMITAVAIALAALTPGVAQAETLGEWRFTTPKATCYEDEPCWRAWMGNGRVGPDAPLYMYLPEGSVFDRLAPLFGYQQDCAE